MDAKTLGEFIRAARLRAGLSGAELADAICHSLTWLYRLENGQRATPTVAALEAISTVCKLSPWEIRYLFLLAELQPPPQAGFGSQPLGEYVNRLSEPAAWISPEGSCYWNAEWRRIFTESERHQDIANWHFNNPVARQIIDNWDEVADWWVSAGRLRMAQDSRDPMLAYTLRRNLENPDFRRRWEQQVIPFDPSARVWVVRDLDHEVVRRIHIQIWRHPYIPGALVIGFMLDGPAASSPLPD